MNDRDLAMALLVVVLVAVLALAAVPPVPIVERAWPSGACVAVVAEGGRVGCREIPEVHLTVWVAERRTAR